MKILTPLVLLAAITTLHAQPPLKSSELQAFIYSSYLDALNAFPKLKNPDLVDGTLTPYYGSRMSGMPDGMLVSFVVRGTLKIASDRASEDRILILYKDTSHSPKVERVTVDLDQGLSGITR